ncbi:MAG: hypothetical protein JWS12_608 [Candidatus Saccharibacteria bacterium]|nr:hypothetical protein [Candidatus Saccharibacteria bacterium]
MSTEASINPDRLEFDRLAKIMAEVLEASAAAPEEHRDAYQTALATSYERAFTYIEKNPKLAKNYTALGQLALAMNDEDRQRQTSFMRLSQYAAEGILPADQLPVPASMSAVAELGYDKQAVNAFDTLFAQPLAEKAAEREAARRQAAEQKAAEQKAAEEAERQAEEEAAAAAEINTLDILEHLGRYGFDQVQLSFVEAALDIRPVELAVLREKSWKFMALSDSEFNDFKQNLSELRHQVLALLGDVQVPARWEVKTTGRTNKKEFYQLIVGPAAVEPVEPTPIDKKAGLKQTFGTIIDVAMPDRQGRRQPTVKTMPTETIEQIGRPQPAQVLHLEDHEILRVLRETLSTGDVLLPQLTGVLTEFKNCSRLEAKAMIAKYVDGEHLFYSGAQKGSRMVSLEKPVAPLVKKKANDNPKPQKEDVNAITDEDLSLAPRILDAIIAMRYPGRGKEAEDIAQDIGLDEESTRALCNKLVRYGILTRAGRVVRSRSPRSSKNTTKNVYLFPSAVEWNQYRADKSAYLLPLKDVNEQD